MTAIDRRAFLDRIARHPDDHTDRLVFADWLEENGDPDRAEYIRAAIALLGFGPTDWQAMYNAGTLPDEHPVAQRFRGRGLNDEMIASLTAYNERFDRLTAREKTLRTAHEAEWRRAGSCPSCRSTGLLMHGEGSSHPFTCPHCWRGDVGGLLRVVMYNYGADTGHGVVNLGMGELVRTEFRRGFPYRVYCRLEDVYRRVERDFTNGSDYPQRYEPTPWALAIVTHHPVTEFYVSLSLPFTSDALAYAWHRDTIPSFLFQRIEGHDSSTPDAAHTAMARALGSWVREHLPPETT